VLAGQLFHPSWQLTTPNSACWDRPETAHERRLTERKWHCFQQQDNQEEISRQLSLKLAQFKL